MTINSAQTLNPSIDETIKKMDFEFFAKGNHMITPEDFFKSKRAVLLDVRSTIEHETIHIPLKYHQIEVIHVPIDKLPEIVPSLPKDTLIATFCTGTQRASIAFTYLSMKGFKNVKILLAPIETLVTFFKPGSLHMLINNSS